jgi:predicted metal-dependent hydrolase
VNEQLPLFSLPPPPTAAKTRQLLIGNRVVAYALDVGRKRLTLRIDDRGLRVAAPGNLPVASIDEFILSHGQWVLDKLDEYVSHNVPRHLTIRDGQSLPLLGAPVPVRVSAGNNRIRWYDQALELAARPGADLQALTRRALQRRGLELFGQRLAHFAAQAGIAMPALALTSARTRWGSCSLHGGIRLNWRLIHLPIELIDYVVIHELCHLREMNHSPRFWAEVAKLCPDWKVLRAELKRRGSEIPLL